VGVLAGDIEGEPSDEDWWLFKLTQDIQSYAPRSRIRGMWLESDSTDTDGRQHYSFTSDQSVTLFYSNILKSSSGYAFSLDRDSYEFTPYGISLHPDVAQHLDELSTATHDPPEEETSDSDSTSDPEIELELPSARARSIYRKGCTFSSYRDLLHGK